jgi:hypothetical protein
MQSRLCEAKEARWPPCPPCVSIPELHPPAARLDLELHQLVELLLRRGGAAALRHLYADVAIAASLPARRGKKGPRVKRKVA